MTEQTMDVALTQQRVRGHWDPQPCDSQRSVREPASREFFLQVERQRYALQPHILECQSWISWRGRRVLEVGAGVGTDARQLLRAGAIYTGISLDCGSADMTARALREFHLPGASVQSDVTALGFPDGMFDVVYSFGVLQDIPQVQRAVAEIGRVLKPGGELLVMLHNRASITHRLARLAGLPARLGLPRRDAGGGVHPRCRVYGESEAAELFAAFEVVRHEVRFFDHRPWGVLGRALPRSLRRWLGERWGRHRILHLRKTAERAASGSTGT
ncbi:MAG TPA: class I SAM-dependent methyltransferase [Steroidobacteraceae bacterium]|nr:class I SAM-dependent methyltransferase [Steroidobacteraceae bacterium]